MSRHRPVPLHVPPPSSKIAFVQLRGRGGVTPLSSLPPLPCPPEGAQVGFELLTATEAIGSLKLKRLTGGCGAVAKSLDRSRHQRRLRWLRWKGRSSRPCRQIDGGVTRRANPERCASRTKQTAPLPGRAAFAIGLVALSAGLQVSTPSLSQASLPVRIPHMALLSNAPQRSGAPAITPLSFSLACGCAFPSSLFSPAPVSPCASRTRHGLTTRHFSHWPHRTRIITIGPFPPCGATGDVGSTRGRKRGGIKAVRWGSVSAHRPPVIVQSCTWYCLTMRHFPGWPRRTPHPLACLCPSSVPDDLAWPSAQTRGK